MKDGIQIKLVIRIQSGDISAEAELFHQYKNAILWKIRRSIQTDSDNIDDLASEIYINLLEELRKDNFEIDRWESLDAFVWGITRNKIRNWFRTQNVNRKYFQKDAEISELIHSAVETNQIEIQNLREALIKLLNNLDDKYRKILDMRYFQELSIQEISQITGLAPKRISERIHYALKLMKSECKKFNLFSIFNLLMLLIK